MKKLCLAAVILSLGILSTACGPGGPKELTDILGVGFEHVENIEMRCGSTGSLGETSDEATVSDFFRLFTGITLQKYGSEEKFMGYLYYADLFTAEGKLARITFRGDKLQMNNIDYNLNTAIETDDLIAYFASLTVVE